MKEEKNVRGDTVSDGAKVLAELRTANQLLAILATKGLEQRSAIALLDGMHFTPKQIASALAITPNAVSVALHRMRRSEAPGSMLSPKTSIEAKSE